MDIARSALDLGRFAAGYPGRPVPRVAVVVAHPDDEVIGLGTLLPDLAPGVLVVHTTDGSPKNPMDAEANGFQTREAYAQARREELFEALGLAGIAPEQTRVLGFVDQEASLDLVGLSRSLAKVLAEFQPELVVAHAYEGGHPDHDASAFAVHAACGLLAERGGTAPPIVEVTLYHAGQGGGIEIGAFLPHPERPEVTRPLTAEGLDLKQRMIRAFWTQSRMLQNFPIGPERFREAPRYDFTSPPHPGPVYYDRFDWGMTGERWRRLAREALDVLARGLPWD